ncbi:MAG: GNAT family N-acetyltransferase [Anaerolineales bacterium]
MLIRSAREGDWEACLALDRSYDTEIAWQMQEVRRSGEWGVSFREVRLPRKQHIENTLAPEARLQTWQRCDAFWIAKEHREVRGYIALALEYAHNQARVADLTVAPAHRRQSIGTQLLYQAMEWSLRHEITQMIIAAPLKAQPALSFAMHHRFAFCGFQDAYWPGQETAIFLRRGISPRDLGRKRLR